MNPYLVYNDYQTALQLLKSFVESDSRTRDVRISEGSVQFDLLEPNERLVDDEAEDWVLSFHTVKTHREACKILGND